MIDLSLAGLLGAVLGTVAAAVAYGPLMAFAERSFWPRDPSASAEERNALEREIPFCAGRCSRSTSLFWPASATGSAR